MAKLSGQPVLYNVVLAVDGMDPQLTRRYLREGRLPNLAALIDRGGFTELGTTNPPQSPVAWSTVITGHRAERHGIFDFVHRDPETMTPYLSTSRIEQGESVSIVTVLPFSSLRIVS